MQTSHPARLVGNGRNRAGRTKLGGLPDMPDGTDWPTFKGSPLPFVAQVDTDDDANMMWGDAGMIYFCIREKDLEMADFEKVWMIFQCY
ncbi:MAG TPA: DUF1963 domain-containing protein [Fimbriimonadaceae bacterium]|nr:DUF1963 domain-containing protein [Fimbriimonadaceae bacterium]